MANNRLIIRDTETGEEFILAKSMGTGWYLPIYPIDDHESADSAVARWAARLEDFLDHSARHDIGTPVRDGNSAYGNCGEPTVLELVDENHRSE
jgi:hypothetical protein